MKKILIVSLLCIIGLGAWYFARQSPEFKLDKLEITLSDEAYDKLYGYRDVALDKGYLERTGDDFVPSEISYNGEKSIGKVRLKGDWTDHLGSDKWSFRVKLDDPLSDGLQVFSVQNPQARGFLNSYIFHKLLLEEGVLSNEFRFVETIVNGESWGVYCLEEHLTDRIYQAQNRKNGIILKFDDNEYFKNSVAEKEVEGLIKTAKIKTYGQFKKDDQFKEKRKKAEKIMKAYQNQKKGMYSQFNAEQMGKYYAVCDLATAYHAMGWINIRFFFDFETELMEPIGYDAYPLLEWGKPYLGHHAPNYQAEKHDTKMVIYSALKDSSIHHNYTQTLERITDPVYISAFMNKYEAELNFYEEEIQKEYDDYEFDYSFISSRGEEIDQLIK